MKRFMVMGDMRHTYISMESVCYVQRGDDKFTHRVIVIGLNTGKELELEYDDYTCFLDDTAVIYTTLTEK